MASRVERIAELQAELALRTRESRMVDIQGELASRQREERASALREELAAREAEAFAGLTPEAVPGFRPPDPTEQTGLELLGETAAKLFPQIQAAGGLVQEAFAEKTEVPGADADIIPQAVSDVPGLIGAVGELVGTGPTQFVDPGIELVRGLERQIPGPAPTTAGVAAPELGLGEIPARTPEERGIALTVAGSLFTVGQATGAGVQAVRLGKPAAVARLSKTSFSVGDEVIIPKLGTVKVTGVTDTGIIGRAVDPGAGPGSRSFKFSELGDEATITALGVSRSERVNPAAGDVVHFEGVEEGFLVTNVGESKASLVGNETRQIGSLDLSTNLNPQGSRVVKLVPGDVHRAGLRRAMRTGMGEIPPTKGPSLPPESPRPEGLGPIENVTNGVSLLRRRILTPVREALGAMGEGGRELSRLVDDVYLKAELASGKDSAVIKKLFAGFSPEEEFEYILTKTGQFKSDNPKILEAVVETDKILARFAQKAEALGVKVLDPRGRIKPFSALEDYFPVHVDPKKLYTLRKTATEGKVPVVKERIIKRFIREAKARGRDLSEAEASQIIERFVYPNLRRRSGSLERSRELDALEFIQAGIADRDPARVLTTYVTRNNQRLEEIAAFGQKEQIAEKLLLQIEREGHDVAFAREAFDRIMGRDIYTGKLGGLFPLLKSIQVVTKLGLAQITNASQSVNVIAQRGLLNYLKGIRNIMRSVPDAKDFALRSSAILEQTTRELIEMYGAGDRLSRGFLKWTGFNSMENWNRIMSAHAGPEWLKDVALKMQRGSIRGRKLKRTLVELESMGIENPTRFKKFGLNAIRESDVYKVAKATSDSTQFRVRPQDLPIFWSSEWGRLVTQFKTFAFSHWQLVKNDLIKDPKRLATMLIAFQVGGEIIGDVKAVVRGKDPTERRVFERYEESLLNNRFIDNFLEVGGIGIMTDALRAAAFGTKGIYSFLFGPSVSEMVSVTNDISRLAQGQVEPVARHVLRQVPVVGQVMQNMFLPIGD